MKIHFPLIAMMLGMAALAAAAAAQPAPGRLPAGDCQITVRVGAQTRTCYVHVPPSYDGVKQLPLLIAYHGSGGTGRGFIGEFRALADQVGLIAACPDGIIGKQHTWNALFGSGGPGGEGITSDDVDDLAFTRALLDTFQKNFHTDPKRVCVTGFSAGAYMAYRVAMEMGDQLAAAVIVNGSLGIKMRDGKPSVADIPKPAAPVSVLHICGKKDGVVLFAGRSSAKTLTKSVPDCVRVFVAADGCATPGQETRDAVHAVTRTRYTGGTAGTGVELVIVDNCNHNWPNMKQHGFAATQALWEFFAAHPKAAR